MFWLFRTWRGDEIQNIFANTEKGKKKKKQAPHFVAEIFMLIHPHPLPPDFILPKSATNRRKKRAIPQRLSSLIRRQVSILNM